MKFKLRVSLGNIQRDVEVDVNVQKALEDAAYAAGYEEFRKQYPADYYAKGMRLYGGAPSIVIVDREVQDNLPMKGGDKDGPR